MPLSPCLGQRLSPREREVARLVHGEMGDKQIAQRLGVCTTTAKSHLLNIRAKLGAPTRIGVALWYERHQEGATHAP